MQQVANVGIRAARQVLNDSGIWFGERAQTHRFRIPVAPYEITRQQEAQLQLLAPALSDCLSGLGRIVAIASSRTFVHGQVWGMIAGAARAGVLKYYYGLQVFKPGSIPQMLKVDFVEEQGTGRLVIVEIDGHNKHGLGYSILTSNVQRALDPKAKSFPGVIPFLQNMAKHHQNQLVLIYDTIERFYLPEFEVLAQELKRHNVSLLLASNQKAIGKGSFVSVHGQDIQEGLFLDFPAMYDDNPALREAMVKGYQEGRFHFVIPPKPFLGSKAILALLRNDQKNNQLEAILRSHIPGPSLELVRAHLPRTILFTKNITKKSSWEIFEGNSFVIKPSVSGGAKGVTLVDSPGQSVSWPQGQYAWVLQEYVESPQIKLGFFEPESEDGPFYGSFRVRFTAHFANRRVADLSLTAKDDRIVHGSKNSIELGVVIKG
jgi:hypothetical protein